jgi:hypothetical protein
VLNAPKGSFPVLLENMFARRRAFRRHVAPPVSSLVNLAFESFEQDYRAVRATYLAAVNNGTATENDKTTFTNYTTQRVNLLAQQVTNSFLVYGRSALQGAKSDSPLQIVVFRINGGTSLPNNPPTPRQGQSLLGSLTNTTAAINASETSIALSNIAQDSAIEATRVSTLNAVTIIRNGSFGNGKSH